MDFLKRHNGEDHSTATTVMDMVMTTTSSMMASMTTETSGSSSTSTSMDMDSSMSMHMYFTKAYADYPVLFSSLKAKNGGQAFGIFVLLFFLSFLTKGLEFLKNYLEQNVWNNPNYLIPKQTTIIENCECDDDSEKLESPTPIEDTHATGRPRNLSLASVLVRDIIRLILCFLPELLGYALMLATMSFTLVYFFAVVAGMTIGRFFFERLSDTMQVRPGANNFQGHH